MTPEPHKPVEPRLVEHIGILVPNLEEAIEKWSAALGYEFSPIGRYRTHMYSDRSNPELHYHDARISMSKQGPPRIELMEVTGDGTHGPAQLGVHHFGFPGSADLEDRLRALAAMGIPDDGRSYNDDNELIMWFTDRAAMDGVRLEYISPKPGRTVADDGTPLWVNPETGRHSLWGKPTD